MNEHTKYCNGGIATASDAEHILSNECLHLYWVSLIA